MYLKKVLKFFSKKSCWFLKTLPHSIIMLFDVMNTSFSFLSPLDFGSLFKIYLEF